MLIQRPVDIPASEITPRETYLDRRRFMIGGASGLLLAGDALAGLAAKPGAALKGEAPNTFKQASTYNNF